MRVCFATALLALAFCIPAPSSSSFEGRPIIDNAFNPTGYTLHEGEFTVGIGPVAFGVAENVQIGTNLLLWIIQVYNVDAKVSLLKDDDRAVAVGLSAYRLSLDFDGESDEADFTALAPYIAGSKRIARDTMVHGGGQFAYFSAEGDEDIEDADASAIATGSNLFAGIEHSYSDRTKFLADVGYDTTFDGARIGGAVLFGWTTFRLKLGVSYYTAGDGFTLPIIGLQWRFRA